jgi:hypothetical protein
MSVVRITPKLNIKPHGFYVSGADRIILGSSS